MVDLTCDELDAAVEYNRDQYLTREAWRIVQAEVGADVDGRPGPQTAARVAAWQYATGLEPDGWFGDASRDAMGRVRCEVRVIDDRERDALMSYTAAAESGNNHGATNRDGEYEGRFDHPRRNAQGERLDPEDRVNEPNFDPHPWSKFGPNPGHGGLSYGIRQALQKAGVLGRLLRLALSKAGPEAFGAVFGPDADELVEKTNRPGRPFEDTHGDGRRTPCTVPVAGSDVWQEPWLSRFREAGHHQWMQDAQRELFILDYLNPALAEAKLLGFDWHHEIAVLFDICIQFGGGGMRKHTRAALKKHGADVTIYDVIARLPPRRRARRSKILERSQWWVRYNSTARIDP